MTARTTHSWPVSSLTLVVASLGQVASMWLTKWFVLGDGFIPPTLLIVCTEILLVGGTTFFLSHYEQIRRPTIRDHLRQMWLIWLAVLVLLPLALLDGWLGGILLGFGYATAAVTALLANAASLWVYGLVVPEPEA